jgi:hypothetical protein
MRTFTIHKQKPIMKTALSNMPALRDVVSNPSGWDSLSNYMGEIPDSDWLCLVTRNRDSDCLTISNFECALRELGGEGDNVEIHRFGHWACGWWEALAVKSGTPECEIAERLFSRLQDYPVLDEEDWSDRECEEACEVWRNCYSERDRLRYIRENRNQFEFHSFADLRAVVRGEYFNGYASELIS